MGKGESQGTLAAILFELFECMSSPADLPTPPLDLALRIGCELSYSCPVAAPALVAFKPRHGAHQSIRAESVELAPDLAATEFEDDHGNTLFRLTLKPGANRLRYDAIAMVPSAREDFAHLDEPVPPEDLPAELLRYTMPSRYCDSDRLLDFAWEQFGHFPNGLRRVLAIRDWLHRNIEYRTCSGSPLLSASEILERRHGVCRDLAHCGVALCRTFNLPTRYASGFVADVGCEDPGTPMDFHAYFEVFMGGRWQTFDARFDTPRIGRIRISAGYDAGNCAFTTIYGAAALTGFHVWSYQVDPEEVHVGDPVDLSKRLCGTPRIQFPPSSAGENIGASLIDDAGVAG